MANQIELVINAQCDKGVTLCRIRSYNGKAVANLPTVKLEQVAVGLTKGDGLLIETAELVQKGNYLVAPNAKVLDKHVSGKAFDVEGYIDALAKADTPF